MSWQTIAAATAAAVVAMFMLGPWPFVALCVALAFLAAFTHGGKLKASFSFWGLRAELEGEKPISATAIVERPTSLGRVLPDMPRSLSDARRPGGAEVSHPERGVAAGDDEGR